MYTYMNMNMYVYIYIMYEISKYFSALIEKIYGIIIGHCKSSSCDNYLPRLYGNDLILLTWFFKDYS